jgi:hypothetical protein
MNEEMSPDIYIPLGVCSFVFGMMEGGIEFWRA